MPGRLIIIILALALVVMIVKRLWQSSRKPDRKRQLSGNMLQCAYCGMYIPEQEAVEADGHHYCSREHLEKERNRS